MVGAVVITRWRLEDRKTGESVTLPYNPNKMDSPYIGKTFNSFGTGSTWGAERLRLIQTPTPAKDWSFGGVILAKAHYDLLLAWQVRRANVRVTDHLGRSFSVIISKFDPIERLPTATKPWRADYTMNCLILEELT